MLANLHFWLNYSFKVCVSWVCFLSRLCWFRYEFYPDFYPRPRLTAFRFYYGLHGTKPDFSSFTNHLIFFTLWAQWVCLYQDIIFVFMYSCLLCFILVQQGRKHTDIRTSVKFSRTLCASSFPCRFGLCAFTYWILQLTECRGRPLVDSHSL